jgi:hypothetical protein
MHRASPVAPPVEPRVGASVPPSGATEVAPRATPNKAELALPTRIWPVRADVLMVGFWALVATVLGRGLAPALPGSTAGIGPLIVGVEQLGAFSSQFLAVMGVATCVRLLLATIECRSYLFRPVAIITCAAALPIIISASSRHLAPAWLMALMALSAALALVASLPVLRAEHSRAAGLVLLTVTCGSIVSAAARMIAIYASHHVHASLFSLARGIATAGLLLDTISVVLVAFWLGRRWRYGLVLVAALWSAAALTVWSGIQPDSAVALVVERALTALTAHPDPFIGSGFRYFVELCAILFGAVTLWFQAPTAMGAALCFALLARVSGDVPLCSLMLILAALSAVRASLQSVRPDEARPEPSGRRAPLEVMPATR